MPATSCHVFRVIFIFLNKRTYEGLLVKAVTGGERNVTEFGIAVQIHHITGNYCFTKLQRLATREIGAAGAKIGFKDIIKTLSHKGYSEISITKNLHSYLCYRADNAGDTAEKDATQLKAIIGGTSAKFSLQSHKSEGEKKQRNYRESCRGKNLTGRRCNGLV